MQIIVKVFLFLFILIVFFALGFYGYHLYKYPSDFELSEQIKDLREYYTDEFIMRAGGKLALPDTMTNHFLNFPQKKEKDVVRVGTFGDSYTFGDEVKMEASYPVQLQVLLNKYFSSKTVEVLNFGAGGQSFQEQFFLWEKYAELYEIDYILYGPQGIHHRRDLTFQKNWNYENFYFPKQRFILSEKEGIKLIALKGSSPEKRYKVYYALFPSLIALRYDRKPFQLWEKYLPFLRNKTKNPFYYSKLSRQNESKIINQNLLNRMRASYDKRIFLLTIAWDISESYKAVKKIYNLNFFNIYSRNKFLYKVYGHLSSLGYELIALNYFNALVGKSNFHLNVLNCYYNKRKSASVTEKLYFKDINKIFTGTKNILLGEIRLNTANHYWIKKKASFFNQRPKNIKSFIGFANPLRNRFRSSPHFPVPLELTDKSMLFIQHSSGEKVSLGRIKALDSFQKFFSFYSDYAVEYSSENYGHTLHFLKKKLPQTLKEKLLKYPGKLYLLVDDFMLGELFPSIYNNKEPSFVLKPYSKKTFLMMGPQHLVKEQDLPAQFPLYIHYIMKDGRALKSLIPEWSCRKEPLPYRLDLPHFEPL